MQTEHVTPLFLSERFNLKPAINWMLLIKPAPNFYSIRGISANYKTTFSFLFEFCFGTTNKLIPSAVKNAHLILCVVIVDLELV